MLEDRLLVLKCNRGSSDAMRRIYGKYKDYLLTLANALLNDRAGAEDVVHDVFVSFAESIERFKLTGTLKGYLATCVCNLARDRIRTRKAAGNLDSAVMSTMEANDPAQKLIERESSRQLREAISKLPLEQREAVVLHLTGGLKFREIADMQDVSVSTVHGRYRYGLDKLRSLLDGEVVK